VISFTKVFHKLLSKRVHIADTLRTRCHDRMIPENKGHLAGKRTLLPGCCIQKCVL